jgi:hypothetical protein
MPFFGKAKIIRIGTGYGRMDEATRAGNAAHGR